jgi:hypothetical protein
MHLFEYDAACLYRQADQLEAAYYLYGRTWEKWGWHSVAPPDETYRGKYVGVDWNARNLENNRHRWAQLSIPAGFSVEWRCKDVWLVEPELMKGSVFLCHQILPRSMSTGSIVISKTDEAITKVVSGLLDREPAALVFYVDQNLSAQLINVAQNELDLHPLVIASWSADCPPQPWGQAVVFSMNTNSPSKALN